MTTATLKEVGFGHGSVHYVSEVKETPKSSETKGNVTVNVMGSPGKPGHYSASFMLTCKHDVDGVHVSNIFHFNTVVTGKSGRAPYGDIEAEAARQLALMLQHVAQDVQRQVEEYDARPSEEEDAPQAST